MYIYSKKRIILLLCLPVLIIYSLYIVYPALDTIRTSLYRMPFYTAGRAITEYVGLRNFEAIFQDKTFLNAIVNNFKILAVELVLIIPFGFMIGLLITKTFPGGEFVKVSVFSPFVLSGIVTGLLWLFILDPTMGLLNGFLRAVGLEKLCQPWIGGTVLTPYSAGFIDSWKGLGFYSLIFMSGIRMQPKDSLEAATIDGATSLQKIWYITIPLLKETFKMITVLCVINALNCFQTIRVLTNGGPNGTSHTLATYLYQTQFGTVVGGNLGQAAAMSLVMLVLVMSISVVFLHLTRRRLDV